MDGYDITFSPTAFGHGVSCKRNGQKISPYSIGLVFSPTTASTMFEIRINKRVTVLPTTTFDLTPLGDLRVVSWNVQFGNMLDDVDRSSRLLKSIQPDVLLLQELDGDDTPETLQVFLRESLGGSWNVCMSTALGEERHQRLRSAIATTLPMTQIHPAKKLPHKVVMANIQYKSKTYTFGSLHFRCCGGPDSEAELQRQKEANMLRDNIQALNTDGVIIAGDWNLVGTNAPLETVKANDLAIVQAYQPDGKLTATWSDASSSFTPGRLDWMLVSKNTVKVARSFVLETSDFDEETLKKYQVQRDDTETLSDHLPLVADLRLHQ